jgi:hypothetical protein
MRKHNTQIIAKRIVSIALVSSEENRKDPDSLSCTVYNVYCQTSRIRNVLDNTMTVTYHRYVVHLRIRTGQPVGIIGSSLGQWSGRLVEVCEPFITVIWLCSYNSNVLFPIISGGTREVVWLNSPKGHEKPTTNMGPGSASAGSRLNSG